jgi:hypothetical protein
MLSLSTRAFFAPALLALAGAVACSDGATPPPTDNTPDLRAQAFQLTIDTRTGHVAVAAPTGAAAARADGPSFSLLGRDAIQVAASDCRFSAIANNSKQKRCTLDLTLTNRLQYTDLVTPTTFPRPPQGTTGLLVFPFTAAALGVPGGSAIPNSDWDNAPTNFFNDFASCGGSGGSDCYRWESFASPLYAGEASETRTVGFNLDKAAQNVSAYIVVAADLRDNPQQKATIASEATNCGEVIELEGDRSFDVDGTSIGVEYSVPPGGTFRGFCSFSISSLPSDADIVSATLEITQNFAFGPALGPVVIDHMDYGTLDDSDFDLAALTTGIGTFPLTGSTVLRTLDVATQVAADLQAGRTRSQFRFRLTTESGNDDGGAIYFGPQGAAPPALKIVYRHR